MWRRSILVSCLLALGGVGALVVPADAATPVSTRAAQWLVSQQQPDGGFEVAGFPGFETPDAVMALAQQAQADSSWSATEARQAILALRSPLGADPLDNLDDLAEAGLSPGQAAKLVVLVTNPLAIDPTAFDPSCDGNPVDLDAVIGDPDPAGWFPPQFAFNGTLFAAMAKQILDGSVPTATVGYIRNAQRADGGWNFSGTSGPADPDSDVDTTGYALQALAAAGIGVGDADFDDGVAYLTTNQQPSGAWQSFGSDDPNSTSLGILGLAAADDPAYDDEIAAGVDWLGSQQQPDGRIASPNDAFGVNTFATSQSIEAILRADIPAASSFDPVRCWVPDAMVRTKDGSFTEPKVSQAKARGKTAKFVVQAGNDAAQADRLIVGGQGSGGGFRVGYFDGGTDVTAAVTAGTFVTPVLGPDEAIELRVEVKVGAKTKRGAKRVVEVGVRSYADPTKRDAVQAVTKVR